MPYLRDFQLVLRAHEKELYKRLLPVWDPIEFEIRRAIPHRFNFGQVGKIVLELGPQQLQRPEYRVLLNVGLYHYPHFDVHEYLGLTEREQNSLSLKIIEEALGLLAVKFDQDISWLGPVLSRLRAVPA